VQNYIPLLSPARCSLPNGYVAATFDFYDMTLYNKLQKQTMDWQRAPVQSGGTVLFRHRFGKYGLLKVFGASNFNHSALKYSLTGSDSDYSLIDLSV